MKYNHHLTCTGLWKRGHKNTRNYLITFGFLYKYWYNLAYFCTPGWQSYFWPRKPTKSVNSNSSLLSTLIGGCPGVTTHRGSVELLAYELLARSLDLTNQWLSSNLMFSTPGSTSHAHRRETKEARYFKIYNSFCDFCRCPKIVQTHNTCCGTKTQSFSDTHTYRDRCNALIPKGILRIPLNHI